MLDRPMGDATAAWQGIPKTTLQVSDTLRWYRGTISPADSLSFRNEAHRGVEEGHDKRDFYALVGSGRWQG